MRVGIDLRALQRGLRGKGIGSYVRNLVSHLVRIDTDHEFVGYLFRNQPWSCDLPLAPEQIERIWRPARHTWLWEQMLWPLDIYRSRVDVFLSMASLSPDPALALPYLQPCPTIAVVYDLGVRQLVGEDPYMAYFAHTRGYRIQERALHRVAHVVTISEYVREQLVTVLQVPEEKITVIYPAVDDHFHPGAGGPSAVRVKYGLGERPFVLTLGEGWNKNPITVVRALARPQSSPLALVIVAERQRWPAEWRAEIDRLGLSDAVIFTGYAPIEDLAGLYRAAEAFVFPSRFEGFGLPPLEAMACGCPVICSNATSLPEVVGDAAVLVNPLDVEALADALASLCQDTSLRAELAARGYQRLQEFSWERSAAQLVGLCERVAL